MGKSYNSADIPDPCQFTSLCLKDDKNVRDEKMDWLFRMEKNIPIWSRLLNTNCVGHLRDMEFNMEHNYGIEIPKRLWSLWGSDEVHSAIAEAMPISKGYVMVNSILALCASLKYSLNVWSVKLMDTIVMKGLRILKEILKKNYLSDAKFHIDYLIASYIFLDTIFRVNIQSVTTGYLYACGQHNLARTLMWFFKNYQFGLISCNDRILAIGYAVDVNNNFFVYDCQNKGAPLLKDGRHNSYLLRTNHLQILLYCVIVALNVTHKNGKFTIYTVDITDLEANVRELDQSRSVNKSKPLDKLKGPSPASRKPYIIKRKPVKIQKVNNNKSLCGNNNNNNNNNSNNKNNNSNNNNNGETKQLKESKENTLINTPATATATATTTTTTTTTTTAVAAAATTTTAAATTTTTTTATTTENSGPLKTETKTINNEILDIIARISGIRGRRTDTTDDNKRGLIPMMPESSSAIDANPYTQQMLKHKFMDGNANKRQVEEKRRSKFAQTGAKLFLNAFGKRSKSQ